MNSYERVMKTLQGQEVDRIPVGATLGLLGGRLSGHDLQTYYTDPEAFVEGQVKIVDRFQPDLILSPLLVAREGQAFGCEIKYFKDGPPVIKKRGIKCLEDLGDLVVPDLFGHDYYDYLRQSLKKLSERYKGEIPICGIWLDPFDLLATIVGPEMYMELMLFNKDLFDQTIEKLCDFSINCGNMMLEHGADILVNFASFCSTAMISKTMAASINYPVLLKCYEKIKGPMILHHGGGKIQAFIEVYKDLPNLMGFVLDKADDLAKASNEILDHQVILGNLSATSLDNMSCLQIQKHCRHSLNQMREKKYIMFTSAADVPYHTPEANVEAFIRSSRHRVLGLACGIFADGLEQLKVQGDLAMDVALLDSRLHLNPEALKEAMDHALEEALKTYDKVILIYGDCHPYMDDSYDADRVYRVSAINCCQIMVGDSRYRALRKEGAFFVFNDWAQAWKDIFVKDLGMTPELAPILMRDMHTRIVYIDTGIQEVPHKVLDDMSTYFQLPYEVLKVDLEGLKQAIHKVYKEVVKDDA